MLLAFIPSTAVNYEMIRSCARCVAMHCLHGIFGVDKEKTSEHLDKYQTRNPERYHSFASDFCFFPKIFSVSTQVKS